ncbi:MAG: hypothetical protein GY697_03770 [Desulfobacterales bacterium]|nr:hypothetical protein [Desulfobacterales bacterium]
MFRKLFLWTCTATILAVFTLPALALAKRETHEFTLYTGRGIVDPYIQEYEINLEREGLIRVNVRVATADRKMKKPLLLGISNKQKRKIRTTGMLRSKDKSATLRHAVDSQELRVGRTYLVYVGNISTRRNATGTITIDYPAGPEEAKSTASPPDLAVTRIWLDKECKVQVAVANTGQARMAPAYYRKNVPVLYLYRNGSPWGGAALNVLDPAKKLVRKGGRATYSSNLKIQGTVQVKAMIDQRNSLQESNEKNNTRIARLTCQPPPVAANLKPATMQALPVGKPDLMVQSVQLTKDCRVMVTLINIGPGTLPESAWNQKTSPTLMLYRNGKSWGGANLVVIDPQRRLKTVNGRARYVSNLKVAGKTNIQAVIDYHGILDEKDEINNAKVAALQCQ